MAIEVESVVDRVYAVLRDRILSGELEAGQRLRQEALAEGLGISRTPLREALRRLASEGLVELQPHRGARVAAASEEDMLAAYDARLALEPPAARMAAGLRHAPALRRMRRAITAHRRVAHDPEAAFAANREFHVALVAAAGNPFLQRFAELLWVARVGAPIYLRQRRDPALVLADADEHEAILAAVEAGDPDRAEALIRDHIERARVPEGPR